MHKVKNIMNLTLKRLGIKKRYNAESVLYHWPQIVGEKIASHSWAVKVQNETLLVKVSNSVWCHHLSTMCDDIVNKINAFAGEKLIADIRFQAGYLKDYQNNVEGTESEEFPLSYLLRQFSLSQQELASAVEVTQHAADQEVRTKILPILKRSMALRKLRQSQDWIPCRVCGALSPPQAGICPVCSREERHRRLGEIRRLMADVPWVDYTEFNTYCSCTPDEFRRAKNELIEKYRREVYRQHADTIQTSGFVMLVTGLKPDELTVEIIAKTLAGNRRKNYVSTSGS
ncbi:Hypothetical protein LUCI_2724 [Lucifera butyrica]|uniref:DUF721 domain-containing protein n=1 Tax=Lucifera butyrica TaxID=1351585 RepID=A0A498R905_9FIRM|nr:DUF721 domain-containing protein [Lucifera butyrica]VBB07475.1 Hypothetical protein LUCI_2724 [Lucifera butyrica]